MDSAFKKLIYWSGHTHSLLGLAVHQLSVAIYKKKLLLNGSIRVVGSSTPQQMYVNRISQLLSDCHDVDIT